MTCQREDVQCGFEPDNCYYVAHEAVVRQKKELDFAVDPPPDLAVEIDLGRGGRRKLAIYAEFRVPEVWWFDGHALQIFVFGSDGRYEQCLTSAAFPGSRPGKWSVCLGRWERRARRRWSAPSAIGCERNRSVPLALSHS